VIDPARKTIYADTDTWNGSGVSTIRHELVALKLAKGTMRRHFPIAVDPPFSGGASGGSAVQQLQRAALTLDGSEIVIGYGGNDGDCGTYWGWLVAASESGTGALRSYQVDAKPSDHEGAI
jgi:polyvinyl alcohol dehydrogenase (cytochrome)